MRPEKYFYDKPLPKYLDPKTVLIYRPHPVQPNIIEFDEDLHISAAVQAIFYLIKGIDAFELQEIS